MHTNSGITKCLFFIKPFSFQLVPTHHADEAQYWRFTRCNPLDYWGSIPHHPESLSRVINPPPTKKLVHRDKKSNKTSVKNVKLGKTLDFRFDYKSQSGFKVEW